MAQQPSDDEVDQWMEFTNCHDKQLAVRFLQGASDFGQAVNNYFDNSRRYENVGPATRGVYEKPKLLLTLKHRKRTMKAPSPKTDTVATPSKTAPQVGNGRMAKKFKEMFNKNPFLAFQIHAPDERTQSYSHSSAPTRPPSRVSHKSTQMQESGVVGASNPYFGPATRDHYDPAQWALTKPGVTASEVYPDLEIPLRPRMTGEPVMIKPLADAAELPSIFTVLATIPMALEFLISATAKVNNGESETADPTEAADSSPTAEANFVHQVQSLAAFLIHANRSYGDIEPLWQQLEALTAGAQLPSTYKSPVDWFLQELAKVTQSKLFEICGVMGLLDQEQDWMKLSTQSYHLEVPEVKGDEKATLYDAFDEAVWGSNKDGSSPEDLWFHEVPNVLVLRVEQGDPRVESLNMDVPASFYMDRYMHQNVNAMREQRKKRTGYLDEIELLQYKIERISNYDVSNLPKLKNTEKAKDSRFVLKATIAALKKTQDHDDPDEQELIDRLTFLLDRIETKVKQLEEQISDIKHTIQESNNHFKAADNYGPLNPTHLYTLRGFTAKQGTTFLIYPSVENPETLEWWRLEYTSAPEVSKEKVSLDQVLTAASTSSREATLVYASSSATTPNPKLASLESLPPSLQAEIQLSNKDFDAALQSHHDANAMDWADSTTVLNSVEEDPPPYDVDDPPLHASKSEDDLQWVPDPGSEAVSDREFGEREKLSRSRQQQQQRARENQGAARAGGTVEMMEVGMESGREEQEVFDFSELHSGRKFAAKEARETEEVETKQGMLIDVDEN